MTRFTQFNISGQFYQINDDDQTVVRQPDGSNLDYAGVIALAYANKPVDSGREVKTRDESFESIGLSDGDIAKLKAILDREPAP